MQRQHQSVLLAFAITLACAACEQRSSKKINGDVASSGSGSAASALAFRPGDSGSYLYEIVNKTTTTSETPGGDNESINNSTVVVRYDINRDSSNGYVVKINYKKIDVYLKKNGTESNLSVPNTQGSSDPTERLLALLLESPVTAKLTATGKVTSVTGYNEIVSKIMSQLTGMPEYTRVEANKQLLSLVKEQLVLKNVDQMFSIFPDSLINVGDEWTTRSHQGGEFPMSIQTQYELSDLQDNHALLETNSTLKSEETDGIIMGKRVQTELEGEQDGELQVERKTGMLLLANSESTIKGKVIFEGTDIPVTIKGKIEIRRKKI